MCCTLISSLFFFFTKGLFIQTSVLEKQLKFYFKSVLGFLLFSKVVNIN